MKRIDDAVRRETLYISANIVILSLLMESIFLMIGKWDITVLLGNLLSGAAAAGNFFLMGLTVQSAVKKEEKEAADFMKLSQALRSMLLFAVAAVGAALSCFNTAAVIIPLFFPRAALVFRTFFVKKDNNSPTGGDAGGDQE